ELRAALGTPACLATIWQTVKQFGFTLKKNGTRLRTRSAGRRRGPNRPIARDDQDPTTEHSASEADTEPDVHWREAAPKITDVVVFNGGNLAKQRSASTQASRRCAEVAGCPLTSRLEVFPADFEGRRTATK